MICSKGTLGWDPFPNCADTNWQTWANVASGQWEKFKKRIPHSVENVGYPVVSQNMMMIDFHGNLPEGTCTNHKGGLWPRKLGSVSAFFCIPLAMLHWIVIIKAVIIHVTKIEFWIVAMNPIMPYHHPCYQPLFLWPSLENIDHHWFIGLMCHQASWDSGYPPAVHVSKQLPDIDNQHCQCLDKALTHWCMAC